MTGPLRGTTIIELAGLGPAPFAGMMLADMGADVIRVERPGPNLRAPLDPLARNRRSIACDLKRPEAREIVWRLVTTADGLIEGFRPGVTERMGLGPDDCLERNPRLAYGRMTGWGQDGPLARAAGHDLNYLALTGVLHMIGEQGRKPVPPLNLVADFGGGGMLLAFGMVCAILNARSGGKGQVVDAAMVDGVNALAALFHGLRAQGLLSEGPGESFLGGAAHWYDTYETSDGRYVSIASIEPQFYAELIEKAGLDPGRFGPHGFRGRLDDDVRANWAELKAELAAVIRTKTRDEWCEIMEGTDVCFAPVLTLGEAPGHPHNVARHTFTDVGGNVQPAPAPRFGATGADSPRPGVAPGTHSREILRGLGYSTAEIDALIESGAVSAAA
ncbi:MAG: CoA transferase [Gammaproteobacteria bacterium]|nr:CoA transferase [Gammaproteobacteria bacterium]MDH4255407.1 CoA transferase [Gammaproteobacteria bacterium]MDH5311358.1 CoA transferase [Gammaproteobacteria bacterium]